MTKEIKNIAASVKARLLNYARQEGIIFNRILAYYFQERFLYRVSLSTYKNKLVLKGGSLLLALDIHKGRPTQDIDFLGRFISLDHSTAQKIIRDICVIHVDDGVIFDTDSVKSKNIREDGTINALRLNFVAGLGSAKGAMQIAIGFKDSPVPDPVAFQYPTILNFPAPQLEAYCWETVVAEKFEAMVKLHTLNSRLKDFYDITYLAQKQSFDGAWLKDALQATFKKRNLVIDATPTVFMDEFAADEVKQVQWRAFLKKTGVTADDNFATIISSLKKFLQPVTRAIAGNHPFRKQWDPKRLTWK